MPAARERSGDLQGASDRMLLSQGTSPSQLGEWFLLKACHLCISRKSPMIQTYLKTAGICYGQKTKCEGQTCGLPAAPVSAYPPASTWVLGVWRGLLWSLFVLLYMYPVLPSQTMILRLLLHQIHFIFNGFLNPWPRYSSPRVRLCVFFIVLVSSTTRLVIRHGLLIQYFSYVKAQLSGEIVFFNRTSERQLVWLIPRKMFLSEQAKIISPAWVTRDHNTIFDILHQLLATKRFMWNRDRK